MSQLSTPLPEPINLRLNTAPVYPGEDTRASAGEAIESGLLQVPFLGAIAFGQRGYEPDPSFRLDQDLLDELITGIPEAYWSGFGSAVSRDHAFALRASYIAQAEHTRRAASRPLISTLSAVGGSVADPTTLALALATGGAGTAAGIGRSIALGAGLSLAQEGLIRGSYDPTLRNTDILAATLSGGALGATGSVLAQSGRAARFLATGAAAGGADLAVRLPESIFSDRFTTEDALRMAGQQFLFAGALASVHRARGEITPEVEQFDRALAATLPDSLKRPAAPAAFDPASPLDIARKAPIYQTISDDARAVIESNSARTPVPPPPSPSGPGFGMGAASPELLASTPEAGPSLKTAYDLDLSHVGAAKPFGNATVRAFSDAGVLGDSPSVTVRQLGNMLADDPVPKADGNRVGMTAARWASVMNANLTTQIEQGMLEAHGQHIKAARAAGAKPLDAVAFREAVSFALDDLEYHNIKPTDPGIKAATDTYARITSEGLGMAKRHLVPGADQIEARSGYRPHLWNRAALDRAIEIHTRTGGAGLERFTAGLASAIRGDLDDNVRARFAKAIIDRGGSDEESTGAHFLGRDPAGRLAQFLRDEGWSEAKITEALFRTVKDNSPEGKTSRLKRRIDIDPTAEFTVDGVTYRVRDFLHNDAEMAAVAYARSMTHASAISEVGRAIGLVTEGESVPLESVSSIMTHAKRMAEAEGVTVSKQQWGRLEALLRTAAGLPIRVGEFSQGIGLGQKGATARTIKTIRDMQFFKFLSGPAAGVRDAVSAVSNVIGDFGLDGTIRHVPALGDIIGDFRAGRITTAHLRELSTLAAAGVETRRVAPVNNDLQGDVTFARKALGRAENVAAHAARVAGYTSLQTPVAAGFQRIHLRMISARLRELAAKGQRPDAERLGFLGIADSPAMAKGEQMWDRIAAQLKEHSSADGLLNLEAWTDVEAAARLRMGLAGESFRVVTRGSLRDHAAWMSHPIASMLFQFRSYMFSSLPAKTLNLARNPFSARMWSAFLFEGLFGTLLYVAQTETDARAKPPDEREKFRQERLSAKAIAAAGFSRASWSSVLPSVVDTAVADIAQQDPIFSPSRVSGIQGGLFGGTPVAQWTRSASRAWQGGVSALKSDDLFTRTDFDATADALFVPRILYLRDMVRNSLNLPKREIPKPANP